MSCCDIGPSARHLLEVRVDDVLLDLLEQLLKGLLRALVHELVALQLADRAARFLGQVVEVLATLLGDAFEDPLRAAVGRALEPLVDPLAFEPEHVVELFLDVLEDVVEAVALELFLTLFAKALHQLLEPGELAPIAVAPALAEQPAQRRLEIPAVKDVFAQPVEERVGVVAERVLGAVPDAEAMLTRMPLRLGARGSSSIDRASVECGLVEALAEMQAFEHEFEHGNPHRVAVRFAEPLTRALDAAELGERLCVVGDRI